jgi:CubicO group peptidase (beta-lactamase class C family)
MRAISVVAIWIAVTFLFAQQIVAGADSVGMNSDTLAKIRSEVEKEIAAKNLPGCVVLISRQGRVAFREAFGNKRVEPDAAPMTVDTVFDLASLTKPIATATSIMLLVEQGTLRLDDPVAKHIPEFGRNGKGEITIEQLLTHQSGLLADNDIADYADGRDEAIRKICALPLKAKPGEKFIYSDVGFIVLGEIVRRIDDRGLAEFSKQRIFLPLGMSETTYLPGEELKVRCAPTQKRGGRWMQGEVHDPRAYKLGGVAGHAGLFSTADDLAVFAQMLLDRGRWGETQILKPETVRQLTEPVKVPSGFRSRGWDIRTGYSHIGGEGMSDSSFGHGGFTGTGIWIDPQRDLFVIFLSNRVHPDGKGKANPLIGRICTLAVESIEDPLETTAGKP